jgi:predicted dehydrogenase
MTAEKLRVGIVGANVRRGFAIDAHIPALRLLADLEISAVCTTRQASADEAAAYLGIPLAFTDPVRLAEHPDVDVVAVSVRVPSHREVVLAAAGAGKHVYCEWPLAGTWRRGGKCWRRWRPPASATSSGSRPAPPRR